MTDSLLVVGTGALACLFASQLAAAGVQVTMLGTWREGLEALRSHGVRVAGDGGDRDYPVRATADPADCAGARLALVLVKSWQTERAARQLAECLAADGLALTLQNGLGNRESLAAALGAERVALGVTTTGATLVGPARVRPGGEGVVSLGEHARLEPLAAMLRRAGFVVDSVPQADDLLWGKLVINAAINPLTALLRCPNGELVERPSARELMAGAAREAAAVAEALDRRLAYDDAVSVSEDVARRTAVNHSSMFQDVQRGAPTEIDAICGAVVEAGERCGVPTPVNRTLWLLVGAVVEGVSDRRDAEDAEQEL
jgi:2-dehydropantoate 2-reductase